MWVHLFPSRTQKLSTCTPTILGGRLPGKIGNANTRNSTRNGGVFCIFRRMGTGGCPPVSCCGARQLLRLAKQACILPTAATRSGRLLCHRQRSLRSPSRTQKLSTCTPTIRQSTRYNAPFSASGKFRLYLGFFSPHKGRSPLRGPIVLATVRENR